MPTLGSDNAAKPVKLMIVGQSGSGKTGALASLVEAGYTLRIVDMDNGLDALIHQVRKRVPTKLASIQYQTFRDKIKIGPTGPSVSGTPKAFVNAVSAFDRWEDGSVPSDWDSNTVVVLDSLTAMGRAAFQWARSMDPASREPRQWYFGAQNGLEGVIGNLTSEEFKPNVIVITHLDIEKLPDGSLQAFPTAVGSALGPKIPAYFNTLLLAEATVQGAKTSRVLRTIPTALVGSVKLPLDLPPTLPIESGLASVFESLRGSRPAQP